MKLVHFEDNKNFRESVASSLKISSSHSVEGEAEDVDGAKAVLDQINDGSLEADGVLLDGNLNGASTGQDAHEITGYIRDRNIPILVIGLGGKAMEAWGVEVDADVPKDDDFSIGKLIAVLDELEIQDGPEDYMEYLSVLDRVGWFSAGSDSPGVLPVKIGISRDEGHGDISASDLTARLGLIDDSGELRPGYTTETDENTGNTVLEYEGPDDPQFRKVLEELVSLGQEIDQGLIKNSPNREALEQWSLRHRYWASRPAYDAFEPSLEESLKALRDHTAYNDEGVQILVRNAEEYAAVEDDHWTRETVAQMVDRVKAALAQQDAAKRATDLEFALHMADNVVIRVLESRELAALRDPEVVKAFAREVLVENPAFDSDPLTEDELEALLDYQGDAYRDQAWKLSQFGMVLYQAHRSITPQGIKMMFNNNLDLLDGKTPREVIDSGSTEQNRHLYEWAAASRTQTAS